MTATKVEETSDCIKKSNQFKKSFSEFFVSEISKFELFFSLNEGNVCQVLSQKRLLQDDSTS